jgi:hypothetical protein
LFLKLNGEFFGVLSGLLCVEMRRGRCRVWIAYCGVELLHPLRENAVGASGYTSVHLAISRLGTMSLEVTFLICRWIVDTVLLHDG